MLGYMWNSEENLLQIEFTVGVPHLKVFISILHEHNNMHVISFCFIL